MTIVSEAQADFNGFLAYGDQIRFKYYTQGFNVGSGYIGAGSSYDDDVTYSQSGADLWTSGVVQPISNKQYSSESLLLQQGKILKDDTKLYVQGTTQTSGLAPIKIGIGSPVRNEYRIVNDGQVTEWGLNGEAVYKKLYVRVLNNGSVVGE